jgi:hypothetical protein
VNVAVLRFGRDDTAVVEERSDGTVAVSFADGTRAGARLGAGVKLDAVGLRGMAQAALGVQGTLGRTYEFPSRTAAEAFLERYAGDETLPGELRRAARRVLPGGRRDDIPDTAETWWEAGTWGVASADLEIPVPKLRRPLGADPELRGAAVIGHRVREGEERWTIAMSHALTGRLSAALGAVGGAAGTDGTLELTLRDGKEVRLTARAGAEVAGTGALGGRTADLGDLVARLRGVTAAKHAGGQGGGRLEATVSLDLTDPANRAAVTRFAEMLFRPGSVAPRQWDDRVRALAARLDTDAGVDLTLSRTVSREDEDSHDLGILGVDYVRESRTRELLAAWSALPGGSLRQREDCESAL